MAEEISNDSQSISAEEVANLFVRQYYPILHLSPEDLHKFYKDTSVMARPGSDSTMKIVSTMKEINDEIMSVDYSESTSKIDIVHAQSSLNEAVLVGVTGLLTGKDGSRKKFTQTFLLAPQTNGGYYVMNDFLFYADVKETVPPSALSVDNVTELAATTSLPQELEPTLQETKKVSEKSLKPSDQADSKSAAAKSEATVKPVQSKTNVVPATKPVASIQADPNKKSYASMLAKESEASTITALVVVRVDPRQQSSSGVSSVPKPAAPQPKAPVPTSNGGQGNVNSPADSKSIHIRGLPYEITDEELIETFKKFGAIRERSIRIKRFDDGFCYAFLEFETAKSAHSAVETAIAVFRGKEAQIQYKKSSNQNNQGGNNRGRSPTGRGGYYNDNFRGRENFGEGQRGGRYESGRGARRSPAGGKDNYRDQAHGTSRGHYENYRDQARGSSAGRNGDSYQKRGYQNGGERVFRQGGGN